MHGQLVACGPALGLVRLSRTGPYPGREVAERTVVPMGFALHRSEVARWGDVSLTPTEVAQSILKIVSSLKFEIEVTRLKRYCLAFNVRNSS